MPSSSIAVLADVHGNVWALRAVLADIRRRGITSTVNLGDSVWSVLAPAASADLLMDAGIRSLRGNTDRMLLEPTATSAASTDHRHAFAELRREHLEWLAAQPPRIVDGDVLYCHGTPDDDETCLIETITPDGARLGSDEEIRARLGDSTARLVACAHSHVPRLVRLSDGRTVLNPGSVGLPAYTHDRPHPHGMEAGSPHARYAVMTRQGADWDVELAAVAYDWDEAAEISHRNGRADRARWIATGRAH